MPLTKITNAHVKKSGFWIFSSWRVFVSARRYYSFNRKQYTRLRAATRPMAIARDAKRVLWMAGDDFYWDSDNLDAEAVELLLWDRSRRHDAKIDRLRKTRLKGEDIAVSRRERIPDDVRAHVWERDEGKCVTCGEDGNLQFDHLIPVAKGGSNTIANIRLLCADCNQFKSDSIV